ncbi:MAG: hypothetical protein ABI076_05000 [Acidobacteriaceae bacterium]
MQKSLCPKDTRCQIAQRDGNIGGMKFVACLILVLTPGLCAAQAQAPKALLLFGAKDYKTSLGCLNCVDTSDISVCNEFGKYGSEYQSDSIWNAYGTFGSDTTH